MSSAASLRARFGGGVAWNFVSIMALQGGTFLTNMWIANLLGASHYGQFGLVVGSAQTLGAVLQLSTGIAANKYVAQYRTSEPHRAAAVLRFCGRISHAAGFAASALLVIAALAGVMGRGFDGLTWYLVIASPIAYCSVMVGFQTGALAGLEGFARAAKVTVPLMICQLLSTSFAASQFGLEGALTAMALNMALRAFATGRVLHRETVQRGLSVTDPLRGEMRAMFMRFMLPGALTGLTTMPAMWFVSATLAQTPGGYASLGLFNAALAIRGVLMILPWIASTVGFSLLNAHLNIGAEKGYRTVLWMNIGMSAVTVGVGALIVLVFGEHLLSAYGKGFVGAAPVLRVLMLSLICEAIALPIYQALASRGRMWSAFLIALLPRDAAIAFAGAFAARSDGALGVAWVHSAAWGFSLLACVTMLWYGDRRTGGKQ